MSPIISASVRRCRGPLGRVEKSMRFLAIFSKTLQLLAMLFGTGVTRGQPCSKRQKICEVLRLPPHLFAELPPVEL